MPDALPATTAPAPESIAAAKDAGLRYTSDTGAGLRRKRVGKGWAYVDAHGRAVRDAGTVNRINHLAIPPAWTDVWICPFANGHIQATGRDVRGRKQYRYHEDWNAVRGETKFERMIAFGRALPEIRRQVRRDLRRPGLGREKVLAVIVRLLEATMIRVGNDEYVKQNHSYGLTTLRDRHVTFRAGTVHFHFAGKSGKVHDIDLHDPHLARLVKKLQDIPGQDLFQYFDEDGQRQRVTSDDINGYLRGIAGEEFSAKDFRTWAGTVLASSALRERLMEADAKPTKKALAEAVAAVALRLGNTPTVCRRCYIHPVVMEAFLEGETVELTATITITRRSVLFDPLEKALLAFLRRRIRARKESPTLLAALEKSVRAKRRKNPIATAA